MITLEVAGTVYEGFTTAQLDVRLDRLQNEFTFGATSGGPEDEGGLPFVQGQSCRILIDGEQQFSGFIEKCNVAGHGKEHSIEIQGRDRVADLVDSQIGQLEPFGSPITIKEISEAVIAHLEIEGLDVTDLVKPKPFSDASDLQAPEIGDNAFLFLQSLYAKRQVMMSSDGFGRLAIISGEGQPVSDRIIHRRNDIENNVLQYAMGFDGSDEFFKYVAITQGSPSTGGFFGGQTDESLSDVFAETLNEHSRAGRQKVVTVETAMSAADAQRLTDWHAKMDRIKSRTYSVTMDGFRGPSGDLWRLNTIPHVIDEYAGIDGGRLISSIVFTQTAKGQGTTSVLGLVERDAFTTSLAEPERGKKKAGKAVAWEQLFPADQEKAAEDETAATAATKGPPES